MLPRQVLQNPRGRGPAPLAGKARLQPPPGRQSHAAGSTGVFRPLRAESPPERLSILLHPQRLAGLRRDLPQAQPPRPHPRILKFARLQAAILLVFPSPAGQPLRPGAKAAQIPAFQPLTILLFGYPALNPCPAFPHSGPGPPALPAYPEQKPSAISRSPGMRHRPALFRAVKLPPTPRAHAPTRPPVGVGQMGTAPQPSPNIQPARPTAPASSSATATATAQTANGAQRPTSGQTPVPPTQGVRPLPSTPQGPAVPPQQPPKAAQGQAPNSHPESDTPRPGSMEVHLSGAGTGTTNVSPRPGASQRPLPTSLQGLLLPARNNHLSVPRGMALNVHEIGPG